MVKHIKANYRVPIRPPPTVEVHGQLRLGLMRFDSVDPKMDLTILFFCLWFGTITQERDGLLGHKPNLLAVELPFSHTSKVRMNQSEEIWT